jgi:hypothetical protein
MLRSRASNTLQPQVLALALSLRRAPVPTSREGELGPQLGHSDGHGHPTRAEPPPPESSRLQPFPAKGSHSGVTQRPPRLLAFVPMIS